MELDRRQLIGLSLNPTLGHKTIVRLGAAVVSPFCKWYSFAGMLQSVVAMGPYTELAPR